MSENVNQNTQNTPEQNPESIPSSLQNNFEYDSSNANIDFLNNILHRMLLEQVDEIVNGIVTRRLEQGVSLNNQEIKEIKDKTESIIWRIYVDMPAFYNNVVKSSRAEWDSRKPLRTLFKRHNTIEAQKDWHSVLFEHVNSEYKAYILSSLEKLHWNPKMK